MSRTIVNYAFLPQLLGRLGALEDAEDPALRFRADDPDAEKKTRQAIRKYSLPLFAKWDVKSRESAALALAHLLTFDNEQASTQLGGYHLPFEAPTPDVTLFRWFWEEAFPGLSFQLSGRSEDYSTIDNFDALNIRYETSDIHLLRDF